MHEPTEEMWVALAALEPVDFRQVDDDLVGDDQQRDEILEREDELLLPLDHEAKELLGIDHEVPREQDGDDDGGHTSTLIAVSTVHSERLTKVAAGAPAVAGRVVVWGGGSTG